MKTDFIPEQLREKDAFVAEHVFNITGKNGVKISECQAAIDRINSDTSFPDCIAEDYQIGQAMPQFPKFCTDPAASDALDDSILKKLEGRNIESSFYNGCHHLACEIMARKIITAEHPDKKICRVLFAEALFKK